MHGGAGDYESATNRPAEPESPIEWGEVLPSDLTETELFRK